MSERFKYAKNGICRIEYFDTYFDEDLAADDFPRMELGRLCSTNWYCELKMGEDGIKIYPHIYCDNENSGLKYSVQIYFGWMNSSNKNEKNVNKIKKVVLPFDGDYRGFELKNGTVTFEYGIQVEAVMENDMWTFNFNDKLFNEGVEQVQFDRIEDPNTVGPLYAHELLLHFHSENLAKRKNHLTLKWTDEEWRGQFTDLLQLCHGVRLHLFNKKYLQILDDANGLKILNVISYYEWYFVQTKTLESFKGYEKYWILFANKFNMRHFLVFILKSMTSLKEFVSKEDVAKMSKESMKMFVAKFLYEKS